MAKRERRNYLGDSTFDAVMFTARSLDRVVIMAWELFEDSDPSASDVIAELRRTVGLGARIGLRCAAPELHRNRAACSTLPGIVSTSHGANGTAISNFDWWLDAVGAVRANNFEPNAHIQAPRTSTSLSKLKETSTLAYLAPPASMLPMLPTRQIPITLTVGTWTDCSEVYTAQWDQLAIGIRTNFANSVFAGALRR